MKKVIIVLALIFVGYLSPQAQMTSVTKSWVRTIIGDSLTNYSDTSHSHDSITANNLNVRGDITVSGNIINIQWAHDLDTSKAWMQRADTYLDLPVTLVTADSVYLEDSAVVTHPSILYFPDGWNGFKYWLAYTPLIPGFDADENPHIAVSNDGVSWGLFNTNPGGSGDTLYNPLFGIFGAGPSIDSLDATHLSDPDLFYTHDGRLGMVFRANYNPEVGAGSDSIGLYVSTTADGITWTGVAEETDSLGCIFMSDTLSLVSPSIIADTNQTYTIFFNDWATDALAGIGNMDTMITYKISSAYADSNWGTEQMCTISPTSGDSIIWHYDVIPFGADNLIMTATINADDVTGDGDLYLYTSVDGGDTWSRFSKRLLWGTDVADDFDSNFVYRPSPYWVQEGDEISLACFYGASGREDNLWAIGLGHIYFTDSGAVSSYRDTVRDYINVVNFYGNLAPPDSFKAVPWLFDTTTDDLWMCVDSNISAAQDDQRDKLIADFGRIPYGIIHIDSLCFRYKTSSATAATSSIDSLIIKGPLSEAAGYKQSDSIFWDSTTTIASTGEGWVQVAVNKNVTAFDWITLHYEILADHGEEVYIGPPILVVDRERIIEAGK